MKSLYRSLLVLSLLISPYLSAETLRIFLIYTEDAVADYGGVGPVDAWYRDQVDVANAVYARSGVDITLELADRIMFDDIAPDLDFKGEQVSRGLRFLSIISSDQIALKPVKNAGNPDPTLPYTGIAVDAGADVIVIVNSGVESQALEAECGLAIQLARESYLTNENYDELFNGLVSMTNGASGLCGRTGTEPLLAHEVGHLLGSGHLKDGDAVGLYDDAYGYVCDDTFTLMNGAISKGEVVVSDPNTTVNGTICGDINDGNNHRVFNLVAPQIGDRLTPDEWFFDGSLSFELNATSIVEGEAVRVSVNRSGDLSRASRVEVVISPDVGGMDYSHIVNGIDTISVEFAAGESDKVVEVGTIDDSVENAARGFSVFLMNGGTFDYSQTSAVVSVTDNDASSGGSTGGGAGSGSGASNSDSGGGSFGWLLLVLSFSTLGRKNLLTCKKLTSTV